VYDGLLAVEPQTHDESGGDGSGRAPLVGRATERAQLTALWREAARGSARLVLVSGEPGVGKSRLVDELRTWCAHAGAVTVEARAYAAEGTMAYGLVAAWLRSASVGARMDRLQRHDLTELARLLPELLVQVPDLPAPEPLPEDEQRQRLFGAIARAIRPAGTPMLLVADDVQWCDAQSLQFVHYLLRAESEAPLLLAATARREEIDTHHPMSELIAGLQALGRMSEVPLERLSREESAILAERIRGRSLTEAEADGLYGESEGIPLFVVEALRLGERHASARGTGSRMQGVISARLARLSATAADLVGVAATIGREFTAQVLADASGAEDAALVSGLDELWRRGLVRAHGLNAYDFSHDKIREAAYLALSPAQTRHHHLRVAQALERSHAGAPDAVSAQIAAHYEAAGAPAEAVGWHQRAADAAQRLHANADAVRSLERALALLGLLPAGTERAALELELLTALPAPLVPIGGYLSQPMVEVHARALAVAAELGVEPEPPLVRSIALAQLSRGDFDTAQAVGEQLRAWAERDGDDVLWVESAYVLGVAAFWRGRLEEARAHFAGAVERYRPERGSTHLERYGQDPQIFCVMRLAHTLWLLGRDDEARRALDVAASLSQRSAQPHSRVYTIVWSALLALDRNDERQLRQHVEELLPQRGAGWQAEFAVETFGGYVDVLDGRVEEGMQRVRAVVSSMRAAPAAPGALGISARVLVEACAAAGDAQAGLAAADEALAMGGGAELWEAEIRRLRAEFLAALDSAPEAIEAELTRALETAERQGARPFERRAREDLERLRSRTL